MNYYFEMKFFKCLGEVCIYVRQTDKNVNIKKISNCFSFVERKIIYIKCLKKGLTKK